MTDATLFEARQGEKSIVKVQIGKLRLSRFNPRTTRPPEDVQRLAERMKRNGFEITRAVWAYQVGDEYEVFAGGTRLEAANLAELQTVPVVLHEGLSEADIVRLADEDNDNDEYHRKVPLVDMWLSYKALDDLGWTQQQIADAKGVDRTIVSDRLTYADFSTPVLQRFVEKESLREGHAAEVIKLWDFHNLSRWLSRESAMLEVIDAALKTAKEPTAKQFATQVKAYNELFELADRLYCELPDPYSRSFVDRLATKKARGKAEVEAAYKKIVDQKLADDRRREEELARQRSEAEAERLRAESAVRRSKWIAVRLEKVICGNARDAINHIPHGFRLLLTDPPYGIQFQSNRRVVSKKADRLTNDTPEEALALLADVLKVAYSRMAEDSTAFIWTGWRYEPEFRRIVQDAGFEIRGVLVWDKANHGTGDLDGAFAPKHELIIHAVKGDPKLRGRPDDVLMGTEFLGSEHPTEKPMDLLRTLITATTNEGDCVVDPFAGSGSTVISAIQTGRDFFACEIDPDFYRFMADKVHDEIVKEAERVL